MSPPLIADLTLAVTSWRRPQSLRRLLASIERHLPGHPVDVEDTGGNLSAGRNRLYGRVQTSALVILEEDFVVGPETYAGLRDAKAILDHDPAIAGVGGIAREPRRGRPRWGHNFVRNDRYCWIAPSRRPKRATPGGVDYRPCDLVLNWGVFRTELFRQVPWDEDFPIQEHREYFWRASRVHEFAFLGSLVIDHTRDRPNDEYRRGRNRNFAPLVHAKHGFLFTKDAKGTPA